MSVICVSRKGVVGYGEHGMRWRHSNFTAEFFHAVKIERQTYTLRASFGLVVFEIGWQLAASFTFVK